MHVYTCIPMCVYIWIFKLVTLTIRIKLDYREKSVRLVFPPAPALG